MHGSGGRQKKTRTPTVRAQSGEVLTPGTLSLESTCHAHAECAHDRIIRVSCKDTRCECSIETPADGQNVYRFELGDPCREIQRVLREQCGATLYPEAKR